MARNISTENRPGVESQAGTGNPRGGGEAESTTINIAERGRDADGNPITLNRRLFMQFMSFGNCKHVDQVVQVCEAIHPQAVVYSDANDPLGLGLLTFSESPETIMQTVQEFLSRSELESLTLKSECTMFGRTYSIGYESDLEDVLINRPVSRVCNKETPWCVWYPLRRSGMFERESNEEQRKMLMEHGGIGHAFGKAGLATDIRLAAHGLNTEDNDFIVGLIGRELYPLSAIVQRMRRTRQTSEFIQGMGPFFVGHAIWQTDPERELK